MCSLSIPPPRNLDDRDRGHLDAPAGRRHARQIPVHGDGVRALEDHLVDDLVMADRPRDRLDRGVRRHLGDEPRRVERADRVAPDAPGHDRDVVEMRRRAHGLDRRIRAVVRELGPQVPFPDLEHGLLMGRKSRCGRCHHPSLPEFELRLRTSIGEHNDQLASWLAPTAPLETRSGGRPTGRVVTPGPCCRAPASRLRGRRARPPGSAFLYRTAGRRRHAIARGDRQIRKVAKLHRRSGQAPA